MHQNCGIAEKYNNMYLSQSRHPFEDDIGAEKCTGSALSENFG